MSHFDYPDLQPLFRPRSIAIIGATDDPRRVAGLPLRYALDHHYAGKLYPVNPTKQEVLGIKAYPTVLDIPDEVDAAIIVIPSAAVAGVLRQCGQKGVKSAVIGVSGFAELDEEGKKRQQEIEQIAREYGIRVCGPNTNGILNVVEGVSLGYSYAQEVAIPGRLGYVSQSGALLSATVPRFSQRGIGLSYFVGAGNQADLETMDYAYYLLDDPSTDVIAIYIEGFKTPLKFLDVADLALEKKKPLVVLKIGRSELSTKTAMGHTGSLVGSDAVFDAICKQKGITRADDYNSMVANALVFLKCKLPKGDRIGVVSSSGGAMGLIGDHGAEYGLRFPELSAKTKAESLKVLPNYGEMKNPFDIAGAGSTATQKPELAHAAVSLVANDENVDIVLCIITPMDRRGTENFTQAIVDVSKAVDKPFILFSPMAGLRENEAAIFETGNVPMLYDARECVTAISSLIKFSRAVQKHEAGKEAPQLAVKPDVAAIKAQLKSASQSLSEYEGKRLLAQYGIPVTKEEIAKTPQEAVKIASSIGYPVVMKIDSPDIMHKTNARALKLDIKNEAEVLAAFDEIVANARKYDPKARIGGVLVQEMIKGGREAILGMSRDAQFGPTIVFGLGGIFVEVLKDTAMRVAPIDRNDALEMVKEIKGYKMLEAFRGWPESDIEAIVDSLLKLSQLAMDLGDVISEIDINPLIVLEKGKGVRAVDALIVLKS